MLDRGLQGRWSLPVFQSQTAHILLLTCSFMGALVAVTPPAFAQEMRSASDGSAASTRAENHGLLGPVRFGPLVGVGLPSLLNLEFLVKLTRYFGLGADFGVIPTLRISYYGEATLSFKQYDVFARVHPFGSGFFLGAGIGYAAINGSVTGNLDTSPYSSLVPPNISIPKELVYQSRGAVRTMVLTPAIGYYHVTSAGFTFGADIGAQVPVAPSRIDFSSHLEFPPDTPPQVVTLAREQLLDPNDQKVRDSLERIGRTPIPALNIRIGWLF